MTNKSQEKNWILFVFDVEMYCVGIVTESDRYAPEATHASLPDSLSNNF